MATSVSEKQNNDVAKVGELIKGIRIAMMTTAMPDGTLRSRPMATQEAEFDGVLWFFTDKDSAKIHEVEGDSHVNISYVNVDKQHYVSVSGRATVTDDPAKAKELWSAPMRAWFPKGVDDPSLTLLRVDVDQAEYWDSPSSAVVYLIGLAKSTLTGKRYTPGPGEHAKVSL